MWFSVGGLLGTLRCIGVTRRQIFALIMAEAMLISVIGTTLGLLLGIVLGRSLVTLVTQTINDLYFVVTVRSLTIDPVILLKGGDARHRGDTDRRSHARTGGDARPTAPGVEPEQH